MTIHKKQFNDIYASMVADSRQRLPRLSDFEEGSVIRSLFESFAYELAVLYEQLDLVYQAGFIDTAEGAQLDRVVAILGIKRNEPDFATGSVTFQRDSTSEETLIPIGTLITTKEDPKQTPSKKAYITTEEGRIAPGMATVEVHVRAEERGKHMTTAEQTVIVMPRPLPGIKSVINPKAIGFRGRERETDQELRERAKQTLLASGRASSLSIENALLSLPEVREVRIHEDFHNNPEGRPGSIEVFVDGMNEHNERQLRQRLDEVRAAGIYVILKPAAPINVDAVIHIAANDQIAKAEKSLLETQVREAVEAYFGRLGMGQPLLFSQLTSEILQVKGVNDLINLELQLYREAESKAQGIVQLTRSTNLNQTLLIELPCELRTLDNQRFLATTPTSFAPNQATIDLPIQAMLAGCSGELATSAALWEELVINQTKLTISNPQPILLQRTKHTPQDKRLESAISELFNAGSIRVAAEPKELPILIFIKLVEPGLERDEKRRKIETAIQEYIASLTLGSAIQASEIEKKIRLYHRKDFSLRMLAKPFQSNERPEDSAIQVSIIEKPVLANLLIYSERVELTGKLELTVAPTTSDSQRRQICYEVRRAIMAYLDDLAPEQDLELAQIEALAKTQLQVLQVAFNAKHCQLYNLATNPASELAERNNGKVVKIASFEKVFLASDSASDSARRFVIQA